MTMFRIDVYNRSSDGNRGKLITSSKYKTEAEAKRARFILKQFATWKILLPHDFEAAKIVTPKINAWNLGNVIITDPVKE